MAAVVAAGAVTTGLVTVPALAAGKPAAAHVVIAKTAAPAAIHRPSAALVKAVHQRQAAAAAARRARATEAYMARVRLVRKVLAEAAKHRGEPYVYGATGPGAFDCSGFTRYVYATIGVSLPHSSYAQYATVEHIPASQVQPGDLLFLSGLGHVAIYIGNDMMIDATRPGGTVQVRHPYGAFLVGRITQL